MEQAISISSGGQGQQPLAARIHRHPPVETPWGHLGECQKPRHGTAQDWGTLGDTAGLSPSETTAKDKKNPAEQAGECLDRWEATDPSQDCRGKSQNNDKATERDWSCRTPRGCQEKTGLNLGSHKSELHTKRTQDFQPDQFSSICFSPTSLIFIPIKLKMPPGVPSTNNFSREKQPFAFSWNQISPDSTLSWPGFPARCFLGRILQDFC